MADFARQISDLILYQELDRSARRDGIDQTEVDRLKGLVNDVAETVGPVMAQIPVTFRQYTVHDIRHCRNVIDRMGDILPEDTRSKLNALEITFLLLSALLHDVGMVVSDSEKADTQSSESFRRFREEGHSDRSKAIEDARAAGNEPRARAIEDALLAEYYRRLHPERVRKFMESHLTGKLRYQEVNFSDDLARLCESHAWGVEESNDGRHPEKAVARLDDNVRLYGVRVNIQYLACILRLADILDFDRSRTPLAVFQHLDFTELKSWEEWNKHLQVKGWEITPTQVSFEIPCAQPVFYVAVHQFLGWIDDELRQCRYLVENKPQATAERYKLLLPQVVDRHKVQMADPSYIAGAFRFQLEYENILQLLMNKSLYPDPSLFLRELLQNALDACRRKEAEMEVAGMRRFYKPKIIVWDYSMDTQAPRVIFQDNGIGMSRRIVEQYFLRVGKSFYRSPEFDFERQRLREHGKELDACSQFGIGILSCFLAGDRFEVETYQEDYEPLQILVEGPAKYFVLRKLVKSNSVGVFLENIHDTLDGPPSRTGTRVTVYLRPDLKLNVFEVLDAFAVNVDYSLRVYTSDRSVPRTIHRLRWERRAATRIFRCGSKKICLEHLGEILVPSYIPFGEWKFSSYIHGAAWFWMLRGPGENPAPSVGYLRVGRDLRLGKIPKFISQLEQCIFGVSLIEQFKIIVDFAESRRHAIDADERQLISDWQRFDYKEKLLIREIVQKRGKVLESSKHLDSWVTSSTALKSLFEGTLEWASEPINFEDGYSICNTEEDDALALHSLRIPGGIVDWSPKTVASEKNFLLLRFGRSLIDVRSPKAPQPAAHRLFVAAEQAVTLRQDYFEAVFRHAIGLVGQYGDDANWRQWLGEIFDVVRWSKRLLDILVRLRPYILEKCRLAVVQDQEESYLSYADVLERCGILVPLRKRRGRDGKWGLLAYDSINNILFDEFDLEEGDYVDISVLPFRVVAKRKA